MLTQSELGSARLDMTTVHGIADVSHMLFPKHMNSSWRASLQVLLQDSVIQILT